MKDLHKTKWLSLYRNDNGYILAHEERCDGKIVAVLPYRTANKGNFSHVTEFLLRKEYCPPWSETNMSESMITGGVDNGEKPIDAAVRELWEESGFSCKADELQSLGWCYGSKAMDTVYYLYCVDVTDKPQSEPVTDGGKEEAMAENYFSVSIKHCEDPLVYVCWARYCFYV